MALKLKEINLADRKKLKEKFLKKLNLDNYNIDKLSSDALYTKYYRISQGDSSFIVLDIIPQHNDTNNFEEFSKYLIQNGITSPIIYNYDKKNGFMVIEDFGDISFNKVLSNIQKYSSYTDVEDVYKNLIDFLITLQNIDTPKFLEEYHDDSLLSEIKVFIDWYIPVLTGEQLSSEQIFEYLSIWKSILKCTHNLNNVIVLRNLHSENLKYIDHNSKAKKIGIIDCKHTMIGSPIYDVMSIIEDFRIHIPDNTKDNIINYYISNNTDISRKDFLANYHILAAHRNSVSLGIFAKKAMNGESEYMKFVPQVKTCLDKNLEHPLLNPLKEWFNANILI